MFAESVKRERGIRVLLLVAAGADALRAPAELVFDHGPCSRSAIAWPAASHACCVAIVSSRRSPVVQNVDLAAIHRAHRLRAFRLGCATRADDGLRQGLDQQRIQRDLAALGCRPNAAAQFTWDPTDDLYSRFHLSSFGFSVAKAWAARSIA